MLTLRLAAGMAFSRDIRQRWRQVSVALASFAGVLALLLAMSVVHASHAQDSRHRARTPQVTTASNAPIAWNQSFGVLDGQQFSIVWLEARPGATPPPGLKSFPAPGTAVLSPGLQSAGITAGSLGLRESTAGAGPGGTIGNEGVRTMTEAFAYAAYPSGRTLRGAGAQLATGFGVHSTRRANYVDPIVPMPGPTDTALMMGWGLLAPACFLLGGAARTTSGLRTRRSRSLYRIGVSSTAIRRVLAVEGAMLSALGALPAAVLWWCAAPDLQHLPFTRTTVLEGDMGLPAWQVSAVLAAVLVLVGAAAASLRFVRPPATRRRAAPGLWALVPYVVSLAAMGGSTLAGQDMGLRTQLLFGGMFLGLAGIPLAMPVITAGFGRCLARSALPARWLAGQRLGLRSSHLSRPAAVAATLVFLTGCAVAMQARALETSVITTPGQALGFTIDWSPASTRTGDADSIRRAITQTMPGTATVVQAEGLAFHDCSHALETAALIGYNGPSCTSPHHLPEPLANTLTSALGNQPRIDPAAWQRADSLLLVQRTQGQVLDVMRAIGERVPAPNIVPLTGRVSSSGTTGGWIVASWWAAMLLLLLALVRDVVDRVRLSVEEDLVPTRLGIADAQLHQVHRWCLLPPMMLGAPLGITSAILFALVGAQVGLTATHLIQVTCGGLFCTALTAAAALLALTTTPRPR